MSTPARLAHALLLLTLGAGLGELWARGFGLAFSEAAPPGWSRSGPQMSFYAPDATGTLPPDPDAWSLHHRQGLVAGAPVERLRLELEASEGGVLQLRPGGPGGPGLELPRIPGRRPDVSGARCRGQLPAWEGPGYALTLQRAEGGFSVESGGAELRCAGALPEAPPELVAGVRRVNLLRLETEAGAAPSPRPARRRRLAWLLGALGVLGLAWGERRLGRRPAVVLLTWSPALLGVALRHADPAQLAQTLRMPALDHPYVALGAALAPALMLKALVEWGEWARGRSPEARVALARVAVVLAGGLAAGALLGHALHAALLAGLAWAAASLLARVATRHAPLAAVGAGAGVLAPGVALALLTALAGGRLQAALGFGAAGVALGAVLWANVNASRLRAFNLVSLLGVALGLSGLEWGIRGTLTGAGWFTAYQWDWVEVAREGPRGARDPLVDFLGLERGAHTAYPSSGYPVAFGPKQAPRRLVAFGGSSTGGASHNSRLEEFYPARMDELLGPEVEVVNQGVGGWTTFHVRRYAETRLAELQPDLVTAYVSCNDSGDGPPDTYERLWQSWRSQQAGERFVGPLRRAWLYQGLVAVLTPARALNDVPAVTTEEMRHNLQTLAALTRGQGGRLLLMAEGAVRPRSPELEAHYRVMQEVAEGAADVAFLDVAAALDEGGPGLFIDRVHLTDAGHRLVAELAVEELRRLEWVD